MDRRVALQVLLGTTAGTALWGTALADTFLKEIAALKPGQFTWHPERSPKGRLAIIVSIPDQRVHVYRNGIRIAVSTCSTGKPGHETPTGVFTILEKDKNHRSSTYNNAPMPNMNRLTWSGVALHAGNLPGYPASHGCIRLPTKFSELLFSITQVGTPVILAGSHAQPSQVAHPGLVLSKYAADEFAQVQAKLKTSADNAKREVLPWAAKVDDYSAPTSIIVSGADSSANVLVDGVVIATGRAEITDPATPLGSHVFILQGESGRAKGLSWHAISHHADDGQALASADEAIIKRLRVDNDILQVIHDRMRPGMLLVTTDIPAHPDTRTGKDFVLMTVAASS